VHVQEYQTFWIWPKHTLMFHHKKFFILLGKSEGKKQSVKYGMGNYFIVKDLKHTCYLTDIVNDKTLVWTKDIKFALVIMSQSDLNYIVSLLSNRTGAYMLLPFETKIKLT
jgi:hypothetical protein